MPEAEALGLKYSAGIWLSHDKEVYEKLDPKKSARFFSVLFLAEELQWSHSRGYLFTVSPNFSIHFWICSVAAVRVYLEMERCFYLFRSGPLLAEATGYYFRWRASLQAGLPHGAAFFAARVSDCFRNSSAILWWTVGNEIESPAQLIGQLQYTVFWTKTHWVFVRRCLFLLAMQSFCQDCRWY